MRINRNKPVWVYHNDGQFFCSMTGKNLTTPVHQARAVILNEYGVTGAYID